MLLQVGGWVGGWVGFYLGATDNGSEGALGVGHGTVKVVQLLLEEETSHSLLCMGRGGWVGG